MMPSPTEWAVPRPPRRERVDSCHQGATVTWFRRYLLAEMKAAGRDRIRGSTLTVSLATSPPSCELVSFDQVPEEFKGVRVEADRAAILKHFRSTGELVPGTTVITDRRYVRIS